MKSRTKTFVSSITIQTVVTIILVVVEMVYFSVISRLLTKTDFGYYAVLTGVFGIVASLSEAGLGAAIIQKKDATQEQIETSFSLSLILGIVFSLLVLLLAPWIAITIADESLALPIRIMSITVLFHSLNSFGNAILYRHLNFKRIGINSIIASVASSIIAIVLAYNGFGLFSVITYSILSSSMSFLLIYLFSVKAPRIMISRKEVGDIASFGGWLTLSTVVNNIMGQVDRIVLPKWMSVQTLGAYNRPSGFIETAGSQINRIFDTVLFPMLSDLQNNRSKVRSVFLQAVSLLNSLSVLFASVFFFNAELIISIFFGDSWLDLIPVFRVLSISLIFKIDNRLVDCFFRSLNYVKYGFYFRCMGLTLTLIGIFLGSRIGILYVALGVVIANVVTIFIKMLFLSSKIECSITDMLKVWLRAWLPAVIPVSVGIIFLLFGNSSMTTIISFAIIYIVLLLVEAVCVPSIFGKEYGVIIYPYVKTVLNKIKMHNS